MTTTGRPPRRHDIDWLRVGAVLLLIPFHTARVFNREEDFYIKNATTDGVSQRFIDIVGPWHMSLLFVLAGAGTWLAFRHRSGRRYAGERFRRLLIPFVFGLLVIVPPQTWLAYNAHHTHDLSYTSYLPRFFTTADEDLTGYAGGFTPGHLWFIAFLLVFSLLALPLLLWLHHGGGRTALARAARLAGNPVWLIAVPVLVLVLPWFVIEDDLSGQPPVGFLAVFVLGFLLLAVESAEAAIARHWVWMLPLGAAASAAYIAAEPHAGRWVGHPAGFAAVKALYELGVWCVILGLLGLARRGLTWSGRAWAYATEAAYPFYILHQTVIVAIADAVVRWDVPSPVRFAVIAAASAAASLLIYETAVRRWPPVRFLFGMKPHPREVSRPGRPEPAPSRAAGR